MDLYQRWQDKLFPHCSFDEFTEKCETLGKKREVQVRRVAPFTGHHIPRRILACCASNHARHGGVWMRRPALPLYATRWCLASTLTPAWATRTCPLPANRAGGRCRGYVQMGSPVASHSARCEGGFSRRRRLSKTTQAHTGPGGSENEIDAQLRSQRLRHEAARDVSGAAGNSRGVSPDEMETDGPEVRRHTATEEEEEEEELLNLLHDEAEQPVRPRPPVATAAELSAEQRERMEVSE
jgi:hypothetical protein